MTLQLLIEAMASHSNSTEPLPDRELDIFYSYHRHQQHIMYVPDRELDIFYSYHRHQQHIMYVSFQVMSIINGYWFIHRRPVSFSGASTYNKLSRIMMLGCCTHYSLIQCNHSYMIPEYDALYDLKRQ